MMQLTRLRLAADHPKTLDRLAACCLRVGMSKPKLHHFNPQSILRRFSVDGKERHVHVFDKQERRSWADSISKAGGEKYFNRLELDGRVFDFEHVFDQCDNALPLLTSKVVDGADLQCLDGADREQLALLATIQFLRVKAVREGVKDLASSTLDLLEKYGGCPREGGALGDDEAKRCAVLLLGGAESLAARLADKHLTLYRATGGDAFWTSDSPIVVFNHFPRGNAGFASRGVELCWPISPDILVSWRCSSVAAKSSNGSQDLERFLSCSPTLVCRSSDVAWFNMRQLEQASRFVYSSRDEFDSAVSHLAENPSAVLGATVRIESGLSSPRPGMPSGPSLVVSGASTDHICSISQWQSEGGRWIVDVASSSESSVDALVADTPLASAQIYSDEGGAFMQHVRVRREGATTLVVESSDEALRSLFNRLSN